jgi:predicted NACHT family NTPase
MINIKGLFNQKKIGDQVTVKSNISGHQYVIGKEYIISNVHGNDNYMLSDTNPNQYVTQQTWITSAELNMGINKESLVMDLTDMLEFLKDYEGDIESSNLEKEYKVYHILKQIKSTKSDFEKISIISKYI